MDRLHRALSHRGPDDQCHYHSPDGAATLVHTRLAILDLSDAGRQPMVRGQYRITFNGELYNFRELREELIREGEQFITNTDTEVLLALYARAGPACLARLRGMFAFALWDERERSCFLARDRFGIKPLYYGVSRNGDLVFASEVKAILATGLVDASLDPRGLDSFLASGSVAEPLTLFSRIRCLEAGYWMQWRDGHTEARKYFCIEFQEGESQAGEPGAALLDSVRHHFVSDVPVGIFLSGGMDSGALVALASQARVGELATFSIGVENLPQDESDSARRLAHHFGTRHHEMLLTRELACHWMDEFFDALDQPTVDGFNTYCVCRLARDHGYKVVLSGLGGDELFGGYPSFSLVPRLFRLGKIMAPFRCAVTSAPRLFGSWPAAGRSARLAAYFQEEASLSFAYQALRSIFSPSERRRIAALILGSSPNGASFLQASSPGEAPLPSDPADAVSYLELTRYLRNQLLRDADVMSMAHGLELRVPYLDHELFRVLRSIPAAQRLQPGKQLLRDAVPNLPPWHAADRKRGFSFPFGTWLDGTWSDWGTDFLPVRGVPLDTWSRKWSLIVLQRWLRRQGLAPLA